MVGVDSSIITLVVSITLVILIMTIVLKLLKQPHVIAYIIAGIVLGPFGLQLVTDVNLISTLGSIGVIFLLFFIGMEVSIQRIISNWKIAIFGTFFQILFSILFTYLLSFWLDWGFNRILLIGFVISLSSTAVVLKILKDMNEIDTRAGQNVLTILLVQDVAVIFMLIAISFLGNNGDYDVNTIIKQIIGTLFFTGLVVFAVKKGNLVKIPFPKFIGDDKEMRLFIALTLCFGFAYISEYFHLSAALGAFIAGIMISVTKEGEWIEKKLSSFYVLLVAIFFVSVGMLIDVYFIWENILIVLGLIVGVFITNTLINSLILKALNNNWPESLYAGALLSAIGEFSFILGSVAYNGGIISEYGYKMTVSIIALSLLVAPLWIAFFKNIITVLEKDNPGEYLQKIKIPKIRKKKKKRDTVN